MPVTAQIQGGLLVVKPVGEYSADEVIDCFEQAVNAADFPADVEVMLDVRTAQSLLRRPTSELRRVANHFLPYAERFHNRGAILVSGLTRYGLMRMTATWLNLRGIDIRVFRNEDEARRWLLHGHSRSTV